MDISRLLTKPGKQLWPSTLQAPTKVAICSIREQMDKKLCKLFVRFKILIQSFYSFKMYKNCHKSDA